MWRERVQPFCRSDGWRAGAQLVVTLAALLAVSAASYRALDVTPVLAAVLDMVVAGLLVRLFVLHHDCGHGSFFPRQSWNHAVGTLLGPVLLTPYARWRRDHAIHHATVGNLEKRGIGDVWTMTLAEYQAAGSLTRVAYRVARHPLAILVVGPLIVFLVWHRLPGAFSGAPTRADRVSVHLTSALSLLLWAGIIALGGWRAFALVYLPAAWMAGSFGVFLFYVQHQFEGVYWRRSTTWSFTDASLLGASHFELHPILAWFTGDIGLHHLHHLCPRIPNYRLRACLEANPDLEARTRIGIREAVRALSLALYDEEEQRLVPFSAVSQTRRTGR